MEPFKLTPSDDTPEVILDKEKGIFKILGNSYAEDPFTIYERIFSWLREYADAPNEETAFEFKLNYINTASSKQIFEMLKILDSMSKHTKVTINWFFMEGDEDTYDEGKELSKMFDIDFNFFEI